MELITFPADATKPSVPDALRNLADRVESGDYDDAHTLVWAIDCGDSRVEVGVMGHAPESAPTAYFLLGLAKRKIESI